MNTVAPAFHGAKKQLQACLAHPGEEMFRCTSPGCKPSQYIVDRWPTGYETVRVQHQLRLGGRARGEIQQQRVVGRGRAIRHERRMQPRSNSA